MLLYIVDSVVKKIVKQMLHPLVWEKLGQAKQEYRWSKQKYHCDEVLIPIFEKFLSKKDGYYVDVGASDGRASSNTYHLEKYLNWTGILIEPIMHSFFRSRQLRGLSENKFFNCACVEPEFSGDHIEMHFSGLMSAADSQFRELDPLEWAKKGEEFLSRGEVVTKTWAQARTLESILREAQAPKRISLLSIDVEGGELGVLKGIQMNGWIFEYIIMETNPNSPAIEFLKSEGYQVIDTIFQNVIFCHSSQDPFL